ncbi:MAG: pyruvate kinase [Pseudomonadota bacterium]
MRNRFCKIVATVGPASWSPAMLALLHKAGVDTFRLNMSHGDHAKTRAVAEALRALEAESGTPIGVFADLQGPKIRTGILKDDGIKLGYGDEYKLINATATDQPDVISIPHQELLDVLQPGDILKLDDGKLQITVTARNGDAITARADTPGLLTNKKGINVPGRQLPISALTEKDRADLEHAKAIGVDYVALSFVQRPEDVDEARVLLGNEIGIISKIEKPSAVDHIDAIIERSDAIMVARGDLGVECAAEDVPLIQRQIIRKCRAAGKPVIVATHMLESMVDSIAPTRAEASDVSNAVYQGADAVMLSAETAVGRHPASAVAIMDRIIAATEKDPDSHSYTLVESAGRDQTTADAITLSARSIAETIECQLAVAYTKTGSTARRLSRDRPRCTIISATPDARVARQLCLFWGLAPFVTDDIEDFNEMIHKADSLAVSVGGIVGERMIVVAGYPFGRKGKTNTLKIARIGSVVE